MRVFTGFVIAGFIGLIAWLFGPQLIHGLALTFTAGAAAIIFLLVLAVLFGVAFIFEGVGRGIAIAGILVVGGLSILTWVRFDYDVNSVYAKEAKIVDQAAPDFAQRAAYDVATQSSTRNLGDTTGEATGVKVLADQADHGLWTALVTRRGFMAGYESAQSIDVPLYGSAGSADTVACDFDIDAAGQRLGGFFPHESLDYKTLAAVPVNVNFERADTYAYCDDGKPYVVIPLKQISGFWIPTWAPYGAAVYDGSTGQLTVHTDTSKIPGPVYPQSLAIVQRQALDSISSFEDRWFQRSGYENTEGDKGDPNAGNESEFSLRFAGKNDAAYVTPLTPRGDSTSIIALSATDATTATSGRRNTLTVYRYPENDAREANSSVAQKVKTQYSWMPDWASGLKIFEIVPGADGTLIASIGQTQSVVYRAVIDPDGDAVLYDEDGEEVTRTSNGQSDEESDEPDEPVDENGTAPVPSDLDSLTPEQLKDLAAQVVEELASRV